MWWIAHIKCNSKLICSVSLYFTSKRTKKKNGVITSAWSMLRAGLKNYVYSLLVFTEPTDGINWCCIFGSHYVVGAALTLTLRFNWDSKCSMALNCYWFLLRNCIFTTANFVSEPLVRRRTRETRKEEADTEGIQTREDSRVNRLNNSWRQKKTSQRIETVSGGWWVGGGGGSENSKPSRRQIARPRRSGIFLICIRCRNWFSNLI